MTLSAVTRLTYGTVLMLAPGVLGHGGGDSRDRRFRVVVRILGLRHLLQACIEVRWPTRSVRRAGTAADALHAATDIGCAVIDGPRRRAAMCDAGVALTFAAVGSWASREP